MQRIKKSIPLIILAGLIIIFFFRLFYPSLSLFMIPDFGESDVLHLNLPFKYILSQSLQNHEWPLWTPYLANGFPLLAEGQIGTFYLPNLLLFRFLPLVTAYNLNLVFSYILASVGMYLFAKKWGFSSVSAFFAASIFTFSGFLTVHLNHFNLIQAASLLPLIFWAATMLWQKPHFKYCVLFAFILSQQIFTGHFYIVFITLVGVSIYLLSFLISTHNKKKENIKKLFYFLFALFFALLFSGIQLFPTIELWRLSARSSGLDFSSVTDYPYPIKHLLTFINPYAYGDPGNGTYPLFSFDWGIFWENTAYVGIIPLAMGLCSIFFLKNKLVRTFVTIFATSLLLVLGKNSPIYFIFSIFPFNLFRVPSKFLLLSTFSLSILAAYLIDRFTKFTKTVKTVPRIQMQTIAYICIGVIFILLVIDEYKFSYNYPPLTPANWWTDPPEITKIIEKNKRVISPTAPYNWNQVFYKKGWQNPRPYLYFKNSLYPNLNALFSIGNVDINTGGLIPRRLSFITSIVKNIEVDEDKKEASISSRLENVLNLTSTNYLISSYKINNRTFTIKNIISPPAGLSLDPLFVYENKNAAPRSYLSGTSLKIQTIEDFNKITALENFNKEPTVLVEDEAINIGSDNRFIKPVNITSENPVEVNLEGASDATAVLVLADTNYTGWKAYVDGMPTNIYNVNLSQRGILFPKGKHKVKFIFQPQSFETGKKLTVLSWLTVSLMVLLYPLFFLRKVSGSKRLYRNSGNTTRS